MKRISLLAVAALFLIGFATSGSAQTVQGNFKMQFTARFALPTFRGQRIVSIRVGTRDIIDSIMADLGISGRRKSLVMRRDINDVDMATVEMLLIVDGVDYSLGGDFVSEPTIVLPDSFNSMVEGFTLRRTDGVPQILKAEGTAAIVIGDVTVDGFEIGGLGYEKVLIRLKTISGVDIGYLIVKMQQQLIGGMQFNFLPPPALPFTGRINYGPERIIGP